MEHFFYCRDEPGTEELLEEFAEAHWSFMDAYADVMIARGPTTDPEGETHTGSMHMVDLPGAGGPTCSPSRSRTTVRVSTATC